MEELLLSLVFSIAEVVFEFLLQIAGGMLVDLAWRAMAKVVRIGEIVDPVLAALACTVLGCLAGGLSILIFPYPLVKPSRVHGISMLIAPVITGLAMSLAGSILRRHDKKVIRIESFLYGFAFAFGMSALRFFVLRFR